MPGAAVSARVVEVVDGDTIKVSWDQGIETVRLIGVDTPETVHPSQPEGCFGREASSFTQRHLDGKTVDLELDVELYDRYDRLLAYVWLDDEMFNERLVARGYGLVATYPPNVKYVERFVDAQREARERSRGFWSGCPEHGDGAAPRPRADGKCDPSYPDVCVPPYPPDLDCSDVAYTNFRVTGSDPHGFDGEGDGRGCEG